MQILVTSSRMPYAIREIRAFSKAGHTVHAADTFENAPGSHSRHASLSHETVSPRKNPEGYRNQIAALVDRYAIDLVVPTFEEVFYLTREGTTIGERGTPIFASSFDALKLLHDKSRFTALCRDLELPVAETIVCDSRDSFLRAIKEFDEFFARAAYSRAGTSICTNAGPLAGEVDPNEIEPTPANPWLVQPYLEGTDLCTFSVVQQGTVVAHSAYQHPKTLDSAGGIVFESVDAPKALAAAQLIAEATAYHGQISLDIMVTPDGTPHLVECNPRPTAGVSVMPMDTFVDAVLRPPIEGTNPPVDVAPAGKRAIMRGALLRDMLVDPSSIGEDLAEIFSDTDDVYFDDDDKLPGIYQVLSLSHVIQYWKSEEGGFGDKLAAGYLHDLTWDGDDAAKNEQPHVAPVA
ncbi:MAG: ATP-grasp domain-containing protein [Nannocystaceae bacterium]|nr:ATP-grasp domain-containing protein [bacterium]